MIELDKDESYLAKLENGDSLKNLTKTYKIKKLTRIVIQLNP